MDALKARQVASFCQHPPKNMTLADVDKARGILLGLASKNIADCDAVRAAIRRIEKQYGKREDGVPVGEDSERNEFYASKGLYGRVSVKGDLDSVNGARSDHVVVESVGSDAGERRRQGHPYAGAAARGRVLRTTAAVRAGGVGSDRGRGETTHHGHRQSAKDVTDLKALKDLLPSTEELGFRVDGLGGPDQYRYRADVGVRLHRSRGFCWMRMVFRSTAAKEARTATVPQRRALAVRDGGCAFPGCGTPSGWCDAHHIVHWNDGGPTDLDNLILLSGHHHRTLHHTEWRVEIGPDRKSVFYPPMSVDPYQQSIGGNSPPTAA